MIKPSDFLKQAQVWVQGPSEADWRSAVSRAYYAAFHAGRLLLRDFGFAIPRADRAHAYLWLRLSNCGDQKIQAAGSDLNDLRRDRNRSDYDIEASLVQTRARIQVQTAADIIATLDAASLEPTRSQITAAIRDYERDVLGEVTWTP